MFHFRTNDVIVGAVVFIFVGVCVNISSGITSIDSDDACEGKNDGCVCNRVGQGTLDLRFVGLSNGSARFENVKGKDGLFYSYNPCFNFSETDQTQKSVAKCQNVAICVKNGTHYNATAVQENAKFDFDRSRQELFIRYQNPEIPGRFTKMYLFCDVNEDLEVTGAGEMQLRSPCVCSGGCTLQPDLSPGSLLLIIFFTVLAAYLVVGSLANKAINGAVGLEIIPNYSFWSELPALVKDGYLFFLSPCLGDQVRYNNIYQNI
ncbi:uncharacterized protein LOC135480163 [Liolophura sinensis]|uniref:uncharacterized protein LOC135480163 n=1 Tax=Liolophura sinensis TaxID=3198878 RepID=UPI00315959E2